MSSRLRWVKVKLGAERWAYVSVCGPGSERGEEREKKFTRLNKYMRLPGLFYMQGP